MTKTRMSRKRQNKGSGANEPILPSHSIYAFFRQLTEYWYRYLVSNASRILAKSSTSYIGRVVLEI
jgi:hypothetical protein